MIDFETIFYFTTVKNYIGCLVSFGCYILITILSKISKPMDQELLCIYHYVNIHIIITMETGR